MHAALFGVTAALLTALCQTATDIGTKAATREAEERLTLAAEWTVGAVLLSLLCLVWYPSILLQPAATFAALTRPDFWPLLLLDGVFNVIAYYFSYVHSGFPMPRSWRHSCSSRQSCCSSPRPSYSASMFRHGR
jgi:hypothetical protein